MRQRIPVPGRLVPLHVKQLCNCMTLRRTLLFLVRGLCTRLEHLNTAIYGSDLICHSACHLLLNKVPKWQCTGSQWAAPSTVSHRYLLV
jgi:hypothetical protein